MIQYVQQFGPFSSDLRCIDCHSNLAYFERRITDSEVKEGILQTKEFLISKEYHCECVECPRYAFSTKVFWDGNNVKNIHQSGYGL